MMSHTAKRLQRAAATDSGSGRVDEPPLTPVPKLLARAGLRDNQLKLGRVRLAIVVVSALAMVLLPPFAFQAFADESNVTSPAYLNCTARYLPSPEKPDNAEFHGRSVRWLPCYGGWVYHTASAICEWLMAFAFLAFFFTFRSEFKGLQVAHKVTVAGSNEEDDHADYYEDTALLTAQVN